MATIYLRLSTKVDTTKKQEILIRFSHGKIDQFAKTGIFIPAVFVDENGKKWNIWDFEAKEDKIVIPNFRVWNNEKKALKQYLTEQSDKLKSLTNSIGNLFDPKDKNIVSDWLVNSIDKFYQRGEYAPKKETEQNQSFFDACDEFLEKYNQSEVRKKNYRVVVRTMRRYELYIRLSVKEKQDFTLQLDNITSETLQDLSKFLRREHEICVEYPEIYEKCPQFHNPKPRGQNTINDVMKRLRTFFLWAVDNEKTQNNPFKKYSVEECVYGTPYYITIEERNRLYNTDLSHRPTLEVQRDIFIFQCLIGCRIADLYKFTKQNVINGAIEYIARKTKDGRPVTVRVPLNTISKAILEKYADFEGKTLFPYISEQKYNYAIKSAFTVAGITRPVVTLDPLTRESVIRPMNEIASSHLARRCFVGNLYKQVKDPNLVGALSGHKEGSRAFARYREIDEDLKNELVKMLE
ncbi:MAG: site-specific integrase [Bacteroidales bacterium]|jgi:site-specific recombinase XerD|nr:site-specific integrase [Bacteroidales bacterium]